MAKKETTGCIYKITCIPNSRFYIGITIRDPIIRWNSHKNSPNKKLKPDIDKYGWDNFKKEILFDNIIEEELGSLEVEVIDNLKPYYNISPGGERGNGLLGEECPWFIFTDKQIIDIRYLYSSGYSQLKLAKLYSISQQHVSEIVTGKSRREAGGIIANNMINKGENHKSSILSDKDICNIREMYYSNNITQKQIADKYNVGDGYISSIVRGNVREEAGGIISKTKHKTPEDAKKIRNMAKSGILPEVITKSFIGGIYSIKDIITGRTFKEAGGPIKGVDY